jgi:hypothetical protein
MNVIAVPFRQLVERRLWPLAVLLLAALVAVPVLLAKSPPQEAPVASAVADAGQAATQPVVSLQTTDGATHKVLGSRKDPFRPAVKAHKVKAQSAQAPAPAAQAPASGGSSAPGVSAGGGTPVVVTPGVVTTPSGPKTFPLYSVTVRFGATSDSTLARRTVPRLKALPSDDSPALIYLGLMSDHRTAVFLVDAGVKVEGDGHCDPSPTNCQTLHMHQGDVEFVNVPATGSDQAAQYELDLLKIRTSKTADARAAARARSAVARGGRAVLRARVSRVGALTYDSRTGTLRRLSATAQKARAAKAAASAAH